MRRILRRRRGSAKWKEEKREREEYHRGLQQCLQNFQNGDINLRYD
jgi:hypothetical protein